MARRRVAFAVVLALLAALVPAAAPAVGEDAVEPVVFEPTSVNTDTVSGTDPLEPFTAGSVKGGELAHLRKATSRTFAEDGAMKTVIWPGPVNYLDVDGTYKPIDNTLTVGAAGGITNTANSYRVNFPAELTTGATTITDGDQWISYKIRDTRPVLGVVDEDAVDYEEPMDGVQRLQYRAENARVTQGFDVPVDDPRETVTYEITTSSGLTATQTDTGDIVFVDDSGQTQMSFVDPLLESTKELPGGLPSGSAHLESINESISLVTILVGDLIAAGVQACVDGLDAVATICTFAGGGGGKVDPVVTVRAGIALSPSQDCILIAAAPDDSFCGYANLDAGYSGSSTRRTVIDFDTARAGLPDDVEVLNSRLAMYRYDCLNSCAADLDVHRMTRDWNTAATWNRADGVKAWTSPGGDFDSAVAATASVSSSDTWVDWYATDAVQDWIDGDADDFGFAVKDAAESSSRLQRFISGNYVRQHYWPYLEIVWEPRMGSRADYTFEEWQLSDRMDAKVNVANGNLMIEQRDLAIAGTGLDVTLDRVFNSLGVYSTELGARWVFDTARDVGLRFFDDGSVAFYGPGFDVTTFQPNGDGTYRAPGDANATLTKVDASDHTWELEFHKTGETWLFNAGGFFLEQRDRNGNTISFAYDQHGRLIAITDTQGRVTTFTHKKDKLTSITDPAGRTFQYRYADGGLVEYTDPAGKSTFYKYEGDLDLRSITDPSGRVTEFTYDSSNRVTSITRYEGKTADDLTSKVWRFAYDDAHTTTLTDPNGHSTTWHHDNRARVEKVVDALGNERSTGYDANSNVTDYTTAAGTTTTFDYDTATNNLTNATLPTGATASLFYDIPEHPHLPSESIDMQGNATGYSYDAAGNPDKITDADANVIDYDHNPDGTLAAETDAKGNTTTYTYHYTTDGILESITTDHPAPLGDTVQRFDLLGRATSTTDGNGRTTDTRYDALDRPTQMVYADSSTITFAYDDAGNRTSMTDQLGTSSYRYDGMARLIEEQLATGQTNTYDYDGVGNLLAHTDPTGTTTYTYNPVDLVDTLTDPAGNTTDFDYDDDGRRDRTSYPNGVVMRSDYDDSGRLERIWSTGPAGTLTDITYSYAHPTAGADTALRWTMTDATRGETTTYGYTALNRLETATVTDPAGTTVASYNFAYDPNGNRTTKTVNGTTTSYSYNAADQITKDSNGRKYTHDGAGNLTSVTDGNSYDYNAKNQTTGITPVGSATVPMSYAGPSQVARTAAGATDFALTILGTTQTSGAQTADYTRDPTGVLVSTRRGPDTYYYLFDGLGSVIGLTDASGNLVNDYRYSPYGLTTLEHETVANPWRFTGAHHDATTGLYKIGHRYYDPDLGRWTQRDPSNAELNPYAYASCDPTNRVDPTGLLSGACLAILGGSLILFGLTGLAATLAAPLTGAAVAFASAYFGAVITAAQLSLFIESFRRECPWWVTPI